MTIGVLTPYTRVALPQNRELLPEPSLALLQEENDTYLTQKRNAGLSGVQWHLGAHGPIVVSDGAEM